MLYDIAEEHSCRTYQRFYQLLVIKGRAVGGGLSDTRRVARPTKRSRCACNAGSAAERRRAGGVAGGTKPLGGRYTLKDLPTLAIQGAGGRGRTEQRPQWSPRGEAKPLCLPCRLCGRAKPRGRSCGRGEAAWWACWVGATQIGR